MRREARRGRPLGAWADIVVQDDEELLALSMPPGSPLAMTDDFFGAPPVERTRALVRARRPAPVASSVASGA